MRPVRHIIKLLLLLLFPSVCSAQWAGSFGDGPFIVPKVGGGLTQPTLITVTTNSSNAGGATFTTSSVSAAGGNYMLIAIAFDAGANRTISSVTTGTGGQTATNIVNGSYQGATQGKVALYGIVNPTTGDVTATFSGSAVNITMVTMLFNNVGGSGTTSDGTAATDISASTRTSTSDSITTVSSDLVVDLIAHTSTVTTTPGGSQTLVSRTSGTAHIAWMDCSTQPGTSTTATMSWTFSSTVVSWLGTALHGK